MTPGEYCTDRAPVGRRKFLRQTLFGTAMLSAAPWLGSDVSEKPIPPGIAGRLEFFGEGEYLIVRAAAARLTGHHSGESSPENSIDVALRADRFLSEEDPEIQEQLHLLLRVFNSALAAVVFDFTFSSFLNMSPAEQDRYLTGWMTSSLGFRRTGFQALKRLCMSMHYTDDRSWEEIGYQAMRLPGEGQ